MQGQTNGNRPIFLFLLKHWLKYVDYRLKISSCMETPLKYMDKVASALKLYVYTGTYVYIYMTVLYACKNIKGSWLIIEFLSKVFDKELYPTERTERA